MRVKINDKHYPLPKDWEDITLLQAAEVKDAIAPLMPKFLQEMYTAIGSRNQEEIEKAQYELNDENEAAINAWELHCVKALTNIPEDVLDKVKPEGIRDLYANISHFIFGVGWFPKYTPKSRRYFEFDGVRYFYPKKGKRVGGDLLGAFLTAGQLTQGADLMAALQKVDGSTFKLFANVISIYCLPAGEKYDEQTSLERADKFMNLPMDEVLGVFFSIQNSMNKFKAYIQRSILDQIKMQVKQGKAGYPISDGMVS